MTPANFFGKIKAGAFYNWRIHKVLPSVCAAQAALESGWGESSLTKTANNLFGMKGSYNGASVTMRTAEHNASGGVYYINAAFRKYPNWGASAVDYANNLRNSGYYPASAFNTRSYRTQINLIGRVYATDVNYAGKIIQMIETYGLQKWDQEAFAGGTGGDFDPSEIGGGGGSGDSQYKTFQEDYIKENSTTRPKIKLGNIKGIVIHEIKSNATTSAFRNTLNSGYQGKKMGYHIIIDKSSAVAVVPLNEGVYHADRTGKRLVTGLGNADNNTISIGILNTNSSEIPTNILRNLALAVGEVARMYKLPTENVWPGFLVDGVNEPEAWSGNLVAYSAFLAVAEAVKIGGSSAITNPDYGSGDSSSGSNSGLIPGGKGVIQDVIKEALYWEGKLKYSMDYRNQIYPGGYADCSSYTQYVVRKVTKRDIGANTWAQVASGKEVSVSEARAGDLVFWEKTYNAPPPTHVGLVISGRGATSKVIHCGTAGTYGGVAVITANDIPGLYRARRIFSDADYEDSQNTNTPSKPNVSTKGSYAVQVMAPTNVYSQDTGGYSTRRLPEGEVYKVSEVGSNSLKINVNTAQSPRTLMRAMSVPTSSETAEMWVPIHSTTIRIAELPTIDSSIGSAIIKLPVKVVNKPSSFSEQIYEGGKNKQFSPGESVPIYSIENNFGSVSPREDEWITLSSAYCSTSVELASFVGAEIDFSKGQTIETKVVGRSIIYEDGESVTEQGVVIKSGYSAFAHSDLLPIGSIIKIEIPTNPSYNREVLVVSNNLKTSDGNNIELFFDTEAERYSFGTRNAFVSLVGNVSVPDGFGEFFNGSVGGDEDYEDGGNFFE